MKTKTIKRKPGFAAAGPVLAMRSPVVSTGAPAQNLVTNGVLNWRPRISPAGKIKPVTVVIADNGSPSLSATQSLSLTVRPVMLPVASTLSLSHGAFSLPISGAPRPDCTMLASLNLVTWTNLSTTKPSALPFCWSDATATIFNPRFNRVLPGF